MSLRVFWQALCLCGNRRKIEEFWGLKREKVQGLTKTLLTKPSTDYADV